MRRPSKSLLSGAVITALAALSAYAGSATVARAQTTVAEAALSTEPDAGPAVNVIAVKKSEFAETILVTGSLAAREQVLVSAQIEGYRIEEIFVEEGDKVTAGQILAKLADGTLKAQLAQIKATLTRSEAAIAQARSQILQAEATKKQADAAFERAKQLLQSRAGSQATYDDKEAAARNAAAGLALARDGLLVAEAAKVETEAQIAESELRLGYTQIKAPKAGMISRRNVKLGTLASAAAEPLFHIVANSEIELEAEVPEIYLPRLAIGQIAKISVAGLPAVTGSLRLISPEVDRSTRLGKVRILIGEGDQLRIGAFARATINTARKDGLGVPETAILNREGNQTVLIVKDGHVETRRVEIGIRNGSRVEILDGLKDGELVVVRSGALLRNGDAVRPIVANENARSEAL